MRPSSGGGSVAGLIERTRASPPALRPAVEGRMVPCSPLQRGPDAPLIRAGRARPDELQAHAADSGLRQPPPAVPHPSPRSGAEHLREVPVPAVAQPASVPAD